MFCMLYFLIATGQRRQRLFAGLTLIVWAHNGLFILSNYCELRRDPSPKHVEGPGSRRALLAPGTSAPGAFPGELPGRRAGGGLIAWDGEPERGQVKTRLSALGFSIAPKCPVVGLRLRDSH